MSGAFSKNLRWDGSVIVEPRTFDLLKFFVAREGLRVSAMFAAFLPWVVYTHTTACGRVFADCADLRRTVRENRLRRELPVARTFDLAEGLCVVAALIGEQFTGKPGWLRLDGSLNVFLLDIGGQVLAVSVSCLDGSGEFFVDDWWLLLDRVGPLRVGDRVFSRNPAQWMPKTVPAQPCAGLLSAYAPANEPLGVLAAERRATARGFYHSYGLGGYALHVYLRRHTAKRFCTRCGSRQCSDGAKRLSALMTAEVELNRGVIKNEGDSPLSPAIIRKVDSGMHQWR